MAYEWSGTTGRGPHPGDRTRDNTLLLRGVVLAFRNRGVRDDPVKAPDSIVFGWVGVVGGAGCVRRSSRRLRIDGRDEVRGGDFTDKTVTDVMAADRSGGDGVFEVEESPYLSIREVRTRRYGLGVALALRDRGGLARGGGTRRGRAGSVRVVDRRGADGASCLGIVVAPEVHEGDDFWRGLTWRRREAADERTPGPRSLETAG